MHHLFILMLACWAVTACAPHPTELPEDFDSSFAF